jgi:hypothetical protein
MVITALLVSPVTGHPSLVLSAVPMLCVRPVALTAPAIRPLLELIYIAYCPDFVVKLPGPSLSVLLSVWPFYGLLALYAFVTLMLCQSVHLSHGRAPISQTRR